MLDDVTVPFGYWSLLTCMGIDAQHPNTDFNHAIGGGKNHLFVEYTPYDIYKWGSFLSVLWISVFIVQCRYDGYRCACPRFSVVEGVPWHTLREWSIWPGFPVVPAMFKIAGADSIWLRVKKSPGLPPQFFFIIEKGQCEQGWKALPFWNHSTTPW